MGVADDEVMIFSFADSTPRALSPHINPNPEPHFHQNNHWITPANWPNGKASDYDSNRYQEIAGSSPALVKVECVVSFWTSSIIKLPLNPVFLDIEQKFVDLVDFLNMIFPE